MRSEGRQMSEELDVGSEQPQVETPQLSATEQKAMEQGWRPKEEFSGDPEAFIDAAEFVRRGELFTKIEHQSKELKQVRQALDALKEHHSKVKETEYKNALKALDNARKQALTDGETDRFFALEERIEEVKAEKQAFDEDLAVVTPRDEPINPEFTAWTKQKGDGKDVDHKTPLSKGGTNTKTNLRVTSQANNRSFSRNSNSSLKNQKSKSGK